MIFKTLVLLSSTLSLAPFSQAHATAGGATHEIQMKSLGYAPKQLVIAPGDSVTWRNTAYTEHAAVSDSTPPEFDTGMIQPGKESKPVRFDKPGTYTYHCSLHGKSMSGSVTVVTKPGTSK